MGTNTDDFTIEETEGVPELSPPPLVTVEAAALDGAARYDTRCHLGTGGMGEVLLVEDRLIGREVAMKRLKRQTPNGRRRFAREARVQGQLEHPAVVPVYDLGVGDGGTPYFTMKRVRGVSLREVLRSFAAGDGVAAARFSRRRVLAAFAQVCLAVHYAHERGVVHRDIKPDNIMLGDYGEVYLIDWGIAKIAGSEPILPDDSVAGEPAAGQGPTRADDLLGTVGYMAPEQARRAHADVDGRADVYALGAILFEILTLERLHEKAPTEVMLDRIVDGVEARPSVRAPHADVPPELEAACVAATRRDPEERMASALELHRVIEAYLDGDRDTEARMRSAQRHAQAALRAAHEALREDTAQHDETRLRAEALRDVGKALALDPGNREALRTLVRLLTAPPRATPASVAQAHMAMLRQQIRRASILGAFAYLYILFNGLMLIGHISDTTRFLPGQACWIGALAASVATALRPRYSGLFVMLAFSTTATVLSMPVLGLLMLPGVMAAHAVLYGLMHGWRRRVAALAVIAVGWTLCAFGDRLGLFPATVHTVDGGVLIRSTIANLSQIFSPVRSYLAFLMLILVPAVMVGVMRSWYSRADMQLRLQTWQLQQLVADEVGQTTTPVT